MKFQFLTGKEALLQAIKKDSPTVGYEEIDIPKDVEVNLNGKIVKITGQEGEFVKDFRHVRHIEILKENDKLFVARRIRRRKDKAPIRTVASKIRTAIEGVQRRYVAHHKVVFSHFPVRVYTKGNQIILENFYGRRQETRVPIVGENTEVEVEMEAGSNVPSDVFIKGPDLDAVTQTSSRLVETCKLRGKRRKDVRVFQDGIWLWRMEREKK